MKKTTIRPVLVKSKMLKDGSHKIRISVAHNNETKYILTDIIIPSDKNFRKGEITGTPNAAYYNRKLRRIVEEYYEICDKVQGIEFVSCGQLLEILINKGLTTPLTLKDISKEWLTVKMRVKNSSCKIYQRDIRKFLDFAGEDFMLQSLSPLLIARYTKYLKNSCGNNDTTVNNKISSLKSLVYFATKNRNYYKFDIDPFVDYKAPPHHKRNSAISIDDLRAFISYPFKKKNQLRNRGIFLLSFYMCGMNLCDLEKIDFSKDKVKFKRQKTENRISPDQWTIFTIQPEAKVALSSIGHIERLTATKSNIASNLRRMQMIALPECESFMFYSARKTFAQLAAELGISDSIIEYCIGDSQSVKKSIDYYRHVTREMADTAIRLVFDFVASDKTLKEFKKERNLI